MAARAVVRSRGGFTVVEVMVALVVLVVIAVSLTEFSMDSLRTGSRAQVRTVATTVAKEQLERVRAHPDYTTLVSTYHNQASTGFGEYPQMTRTTRVTRTTVTTAPRADYTTVTVRVTEPSMSQPVNLTIVVAAP